MKNYSGIPMCPECGKPMQHIEFICCKETVHGWVCRPCQPYYKGKEPEYRCCETENKKRHKRGSKG